MSTFRPRARVTLPDGQTITAAVIRREKTRAGVWWYLLEITLISRHRPERGPDRPEPEPAEFWAAYPAVQPIPGEDYAVLNERTWVAVPVRHRTGHVEIHGTDCWMATDTGAESITAEQATDLIAQGRGQVCGGCIARGLGRRSVG